MPKAKVYFKSVTPYSQSKQYERECPKRDNETHDLYKERTWRLHAHTNSNKLVELPKNGGNITPVARMGDITIPGVVFQRVTLEAASYRRDKIPNKGQKTFIDVFKTGLIVLGDLVLPIKGVDVEGEWLSLSGMGRKGETGVWKCYPRIAEWEGEVEFLVLDDLLLSKTPRGSTVLEETLHTAGQFGIGRWRPIKSGGGYGRFAVASVELTE